MRARSVVFGIVGLGVLVGTMAFIHAGQDDLSAFRSFAVQDKTHYYLPFFIGQWAGGPGAEPPPPPKGPPYEVRVLILNHATRDQVDKLVKSQLCDREGWHVKYSRNGLYDLVKDTGQMMEIEVDYHEPYPLMTRARNRQHVGETRIEEKRDMSTIDIWMLKLKRMRRDPYDDSSTYFQS